VHEGYLLALANLLLDAVELLLLLRLKTLKKIRHNRDQKPEVAYDKVSYYRKAVRPVFAAFPNVIFCLQNFCQALLI
jgi:hypothetical protein